MSPAPPSLALWGTNQQNDCQNQLKSINLEIVHPNWCQLCCVWHTVGMSFTQGRNPTPTMSPAPLAPALWGTKQPNDGQNQLRSITLQLIVGPNRHQLCYIWLTLDASITQGSKLDLNFVHSPTCPCTVGHNSAQRRPKWGKMDKSGGDTPKTVFDCAAFDTL